MDSKYTFTEDWFSEQNGEPVIREFNKFLSPYAGKPCKFLEIGSYEGMSALWMLENILTHNSSRLWCIDAWADWTGEAFKTFINNLSASGHKDKVEIIKGCSSDHLGNFSKNFFDFIYIDGNHDEKQVLSDAIMSFRLLTSGGIIAFDDYLMGIRYPDSPGSKTLKGLPKNSIDYFLDLFRDELEVIHSDYQLWIRKTL
ncbi:MAG: class I SAM-dependent methyltransferase [SAR202 cluster bacterium]|nr:class I SAM-dependent methyltransferase [SAR202 cluster bacterium]|tara:strand:- start:4265 stop:4861 length:597 start_codon:yes stop_codon:yes gene_type:complete